VLQAQALLQAQVCSRLQAPGSRLQVQVQAPGSVLSPQAFCSQVPRPACSRARLTSAPGPCSRRSRPQAQAPGEACVCKGSIPRPGFQASRPRLCSPGSRLVSLPCLCSVPSLRLQLDAPGSVPGSRLQETPGLHPGSKVLDGSRAPGSAVPLLCAPGFQVLQAQAPGSCVCPQAPQCTTQCSAPMCVPPCSLAMCPGSRPCVCPCPGCLVPGLHSSILSHVLRGTVCSCTPGSCPISFQVCAPCYLF
jgi:hypothetical protein